MQFVRSSSRSSPTKIVEEDNQIYTAGIEVKPEFPGGMAKFYKYVGDNYRAPEEEGLRGKVYVTFVVEKDGSLTDIKVLRDIGYGTGKEP
jgi:protein TonB